MDAKRAARSRPHTNLQGAQTMATENSFVITLGVDKSSAFRVTLAFTLGVAAFEKDLKPTIVLIMEGTQNARRGYVDDIDIGEPFLCVKDLMEVFLAQGGELVVCAPCLKQQGMSTEELLPGIKTVRGPDVVEMLANAKCTLQLN
jgi:tRNA 2-thiouridine synthesizing protein D